MDEKQGINLMLYSEQFNNPSWEKSSGVTILQNVITSPNGDLTGDKILYPINALGWLEASTGPFTFIADTPYTMSIFARGSEKNTLTLVAGTNTLYNSTGESVSAIFDLIQQTTTSSRPDVTSRIEAFPNEWYRCSISFTPTSSSTYRPRFAGATDTVNDVTGIFIWGAQLESADTVGFYTTTESTPVTSNVPLLLEDTTLLYKY
jgi:hypothetical protein